MLGNAAHTTASLLRLHGCPLPRSALGPLFHPQRRCCGAAESGQMRAASCEATDAQMAPAQTPRARTRQCRKALPAASTHAGEASRQLNDEQRGFSFGSHCPCKGRGYCSAAHGSAPCKAAWGRTRPRLEGQKNKRLLPFKTRRGPCRHNLARNTSTWPDSSFHLALPSCRYAPHLASTHFLHVGTANVWHNEHRNQVRQRGCLQD